jgi:NAD(P)-dependent dehydrogenase (short-subunit alcohol dehydrogenase family)
VEHDHADRVDQIDGLRHDGPQVRPHRQYHQPVGEGADRLLGSTKKAAEQQGIPVEKAMEMRKAGVPAGRFGQPGEFGQAAAFLCSAHSGFITGQNLLLDGGIFPGAL